MVLRLREPPQAAVRRRGLAVPRQRHAQVALHRQVVRRPRPGHVRVAGLRRQARVQAAGVRAGAT